MSPPDPPSLPHGQPDPPQAVACPRCGGALAVSDEQWGAPADCPLCGASFQVPRPDARRPLDAGAAAELEFQEPIRTVGSGDDVVVLRRLSESQKAARRTRRTVVMLVAGVAMLLSIVLLLGRKG